jgi:cupin fold WbuC family metalloprotein
MREANEAVFNTEDVVGVDQAMVDYLKKRASDAPRRCFRLCMHHDTEDPVQEMIVAFCKGSYSRPHYHPASSASIHIIEGEMDVFFFDDRGNVTQRVPLGAKGTGKTFCLRNELGSWHMTVPRSEFTVMHEVTAGPFVREECNLFADWSPEPTDAEGIAAFLKKLYPEA